MTVPLLQVRNLDVRFDTPPPATEVHDVMASLGHPETVVQGAEGGRLLIRTNEMQPEEIAKVQASSGMSIDVRWQRRDDATTCMEVYEQVRDAPRFEALLAREARLRGFERFLAPGAARRTECFVAAPD